MFDLKMILTAICLCISITVCGLKYTTNSGTFRSPRDKRGQFSCSWTIQVPTGYRVRLSFGFFTVGGRYSRVLLQYSRTWYITKDFTFKYSIFYLVSRTECTRGSDYVTIRDGEYSTSSLLKSLCGSGVQGYVYSSGNKMLVTLRSANNIRQAGFSATWLAVAIPTIPPTVREGREFI